METGLDQEPPAASSIKCRPGSPSTEPSSSWKSQHPRRKWPQGLRCTSPGRASLWPGAVPCWENPGRQARDPGRILMGFLRSHLSTHNHGPRRGHSTAQAGDSLSLPTPG